jgi:hypothetical protein
MRRRVQSNRQEHGTCELKSSASRRWPAPSKANSNSCDLNDLGVTQISRRLRRSAAPRASAHHQSRFVENPREPRTGLPIPPSLAHRSGRGSVSVGVVLSSEDGGTPPSPCRIHGRSASRPGEEQTSCGSAVFRQRDQNRNGAAVVGTTTPSLSYSRERLGAERNKTDRP